MKQEHKMDFSEYLSDEVDEVIAIARELETVKLFHVEEKKM